jgi:hypothetical protein
MSAGSLSTSDQDSPSERANEPASATRPTPESNAPDASPRPQESKGEERTSQFDLAMLKRTRVVAIFTVVLAGVGGIQAWAFIQSERASLYVNILSIEPSPVQPLRPFSIRLSITNTGRSQAFIVEAKPKAWVSLSLPEKPDLTDVKFSAVGAPVPAGGTRFIVNGPLSPTLTGFQIEDIGRGVLRLYIFGYVKFTDDFSVFGARTLGFCGIYNPFVKSTDGGISITQCDNPNYTYGD